MTHIPYREILLRIVSAWEYAVLYVGSGTILSGVLINLVNKWKQTGTVVKRESNIVATLSMTFFFAAMFFLGWFAVGKIQLSEETETASKLAGAVSVLFGAMLNIAGRIALGRFWSDQIEIREDHQLVRQWPYTWARHPMYGSLIIFGVGMGLLVINPLVVIATLTLFTPAMIFRSYREEVNLIAAFGDEYRQFQSEVPMILPALPEWISRFARAGLAAMQVWGAWFYQLDMLVLSAVLTLGLSFIMKREDFRIAYKIKPVVIIACVALAAGYMPLAIVLWIPAAASLMSLTGQCPGTVFVNAIRRRQEKEFLP